MKLADMAESARLVAAARAATANRHRTRTTRCRGAAGWSAKPKAVGGELAPTAPMMPARFNAPRRPATPVYVPPVTHCVYGRLEPRRCVDSERGRKRRRSCRYHTNRAPSRTKSKRLGLGSRRRSFRLVSPRSARLRFSRRKPTPQGRITAMAPTSAPAVAVDAARPRAGRHTLRRGCGGRGGRGGPRRHRDADGGRGRGGPQRP